MNHEECNKLSGIQKWMLVIGLLALLTIVTISLFMPQKEKIITFNITGITTDINTTTLTQIHYECIKFCAIRDYSDKCWEQCATLGKETIGKCPDCPRCA